MWTGVGMVVVVVAMVWLARRERVCTCLVPETVVNLRCPIHAALAAAVAERRHIPDDTLTPVRAAADIEAVLSNAITAQEDSL